jgi:hypothetical protein
MSLVWQITSTTVGRAWALPPQNAIVADGGGVRLGAC